MLHTKAHAKLELIESPTENHRMAAKASITEYIKTQKTVEQSDFIKFAQDNKQDDLLYFKAIYATCGFNLNDDVFDSQEFWKARTSPIWKPINWQHNENEIIGVIYATQAQYLDGTLIDIESSEVPQKDFELIIYGAIYKHLFPEIAKEIRMRNAEASLFVSMETWFSDYSYALLDETKGTIAVVERNSETIALDKNLKYFGGTGKFEEKRIGRVLLDMTFRGVGIVDEPANRRSKGKITQAEIQETTMADDIKVELEKAKSELSAVAAKVPELEAALAASKENAERLAKRTEAHEALLKLSDAISKNLDAAIAGLTPTTPPEIAKIDSALDKSADALFAAKISWLAQTGTAFASKIKELETSAADLQKTLTEKVAELNAVKAKCAEMEEEKTKEKVAKEKKARMQKRCAEVLEVFKDEKVVETLTPNFSELEEDAYNNWLEEKKVIVAGISLKKDGGAGSPQEEGKSGESKVKSGPRDTISVASVLENAVVEQTVAPKEVDNKASEGFNFALLLKK